MRERQRVPDPDRIEAVLQPAQVLLQWFISEQVEEEKSACHVVESLKLIGDSRPALLLLDRELGERQAEAE